LDRDSIAFDANNWPLTTVRLNRFAVETRYVLHIDYNIPIENPPCACPQLLSDIAFCWLAPIRQVRENAEAMISPEDQLVIMCVVMDAPDSE
jgi:hypothetical protein